MRCVINKADPGTAAAEQVVLVADRAGGRAVAVVAVAVDSGAAARGAGRAGG